MNKLATYQIRYLQRVYGLSDEQAKAIASFIWWQS